MRPTERSNNAKHALRSEAILLHRTRRAVAMTIREARDAFIDYIPTIPRGCHRQLPSTIHVQRKSSASQKVGEGPA